ncbi:MAG: 2-oxo acid dehydrogenase subunit E2 [Myxococcota bacterium]|jgi:2-oxoglutarate dehydrogenase E2 component (dihydrolipoamide succinyltransferase)|nr:2-oxo acid dehydrogenase subunit E2 [Myxococcota bacterium]
MTTKVTMPQLGESVVEGTVGRWLVKEGDAVTKDQPLLEVLTDKADTEVPSPVAGVVTKLHAAVDDVVPVGGLLVEISEGATAAPKAPAAEAPKASAAAKKDEPAASPSVRKLARENDVDLQGVSGSGDGGRITHEDVRAAAKPAAPAPAAPAAVPAAAAPATPAARPAVAPPASSGASGAFRLPPYVPAPGDEVVAFTRRRRIIADHMVFSKHTSPEVVTFAECDLNKTHLLREAHKKQYEKEGHSLTFLAFVVAATARALREHPELNARVLDDAYVKLRAINLGIAVDTPEGLVVPVIKNADELTLRGLARSITELANRARDGKLTPDDLANKTFTISNPGRKGNLVGGAIISQPNVGILRLGTIKKRPVVIERDGEDLIGIHPVMYMALTYDHRVVDGVHANSFLYRISEILEQGDFEV